MDYQQKPAPQKTDIVCDQCGHAMVIKEGRYGKFTACSNYPDCKNILKDKKHSAPAEKVGRLCPEDSGELLYRNGKFGKFIACVNFPKCKYTEKIAQNS